ncbi:MAG TPA: metallophosphoesterase family protein [Usitatibacter sp.]|nr:metallophosphoesterase family protein [Usitatibacter sp.]
MALYGVLGDIHGNREALEAALAALGEHSVDAILCVGDLVGYNADGNECVEMLTQCGALCIAGNHDLIGTGLLGFERCSNKAMHSLKRTRRALSPAAVRELQSLPAHRRIEDRVVLVHGGVRDVQQYMTQPRHILQNAAYLREDFPGASVCFFGHTHEQRVYETDGQSVREIDVHAPAVALRPDRIHFVNPGSVDASRKRSQKYAELAIFDSERLACVFRRVPYDDAATEAKAAAQGYRIDGWRDRIYDWQRRVIGPRQVDVT